MRRTLGILAVSALLVAGGVAYARHGDDVRPTDTATAAWRRIVPGGDCRCANGSEFSFWDRPADPTRVVLFLNGGGVCWDAKMCAFTSTDSPGENDYYNWSQESAESPDDEQSGFFDLTRADNPFAGWSVVYLSSCTGDAHLGNTAQKISATLTVQHRGLVNGTAALDYLAEHYPNATQIVVVGKTAGSIAAPLYGGLVADRLPHAKVTVFGAQSGGWPDNPDLDTEVLGTAWGAYAAMPAWAIDGLTVSEWGVPRFWVQAARHAPGLVLSRFDYDADPHAASEVTAWMPGSVATVIKTNEIAIEKAGVTLHSYTAPGASHGIFEGDVFYDLSVDGVHLTDWLKQLTTATPPADVR